MGATSESITTIRARDWRETETSKVMGRGKAGHERNLSAARTFVCTMSHPKNAKLQVKHSSNNDNNNSVATTDCGSRGKKKDEKEGGKKRDIFT